MKKLIMMAVFCTAFATIINACPAVVIPVSGHIRNEAGRSIRGTGPVIFIDQTNDQIYLANVDSRGAYSVEIPNCHEYKISLFTTGRYYFDTIDFETDTSMAEGFGLDILGILINEKI